MVDRRSRRRAQSNLNTTTGLRSSPSPSLTRLARVNSRYGSGGSRVGLQYTIKNGKVARMTGS